MAGLCEGGNEPAGSLKASKQGIGYFTTCYQLLYLEGTEVEPHALHGLGTRMRWCGRHHALTAFYPRERPGTQFYRRLSEPRGRCENLATRKNPVNTWDRTRDLPVRSQLLYQLSYPLIVTKIEGYTGKTNNVTFPLKTPELFLVIRICIRWRYDSDIKVVTAFDLYRAEYAFTNRGSRISPRTVQSRTEEVA
ncbi:hypothetical protein ANN_05768 [Periplaneta americana]|uniref:Uncharacterized protein n=1 Tax=Periplaneta americana TaxID=6978 RepID=A0ABQ8TBU2_PERAM|nr:hypothetical protein ANN_05768 [Periplaneta americana]